MPDVFLRFIIGHEQLISPDTTIQPNERKVFVVACPEGARVTGGGSVLGYPGAGPDPADKSVILESSYPLFNETGDSGTADGWRAIYVNMGGTAKAIRVSMLAIYIKKKKLWWW